MLDEQHIIAKVLAGETAAFRGLVDTYQQTVFLFACNMLRRTQDAEDLTQEVFVAAFQNLRTFDPARARFSTWLMTIARNRCCSQLKRRSLNTPGDVDSADRQPGPEEAASYHEARQRLSAALESLPLEQRTAFVLAEIQELPHAEIAVIEGIELGTVKSRVSRARERLREALKAWQPVHQAASTRPQDSVPRRPT